MDPLIRHLLALGRTCRRASSLKEAFPAEEHEETDHFARLVMLLRKEKTRPARRKGLAGKVKNWLTDLTERARLALIQRLLDESIVRESDKGNLRTIFDFTRATMKPIAPVRLGAT